MGVSANEKGFVFEIPKDYDIKEIGEKLDDFEILQKLGQGGNGFAIKVRSKKNYKIYVIKKSKEFTDEEKIELLLLKKLDHPNICKCLTHFEENGFNYIVMDLYSNKDLYRYFQAYSKLKRKIKEENLWNIFHQCLEALAYIHNKGLIHRDIKLGNIFMKENGNVAIGDFGLCRVFDRNEYNQLPQGEKRLLKFEPTQCGTPGFAAPEVEKGCNYDQKVDVYSLGVCFYGLLYKTFPKGNYEDFLKADKTYDFELRNIIFFMLKQNPNERPSSTDVYRYFKNKYIKKYVANSSIYSVIHCLFNFPNFLEYFSDQFQIQYILEKEYRKDIFLSLLGIKNNINNIDEIEENAYVLRKKIIGDEIKIKDNNELSLLQVINSIIGSLYYELNEIDQKIGENLKMSACEFNNFDNFINHFNNHFYSIISKNFTGVLKKTLKCSRNNCPGENIIFQKFNFINFNINNYIGYFNQNSFINIASIFKYFNQEYKSFDYNRSIYCNNCRRNTKHYENKKFYCLPKNIIILLDKSQCNNNYAFVDFDEKLYISDEKNGNQCIYEYDLLGVISEINNMNNLKSKYVSFIKRNNNWIYCDNQSPDSGKYINFAQLKTFGNILALFYYDGKRIISADKDININNNINQQNIQLVQTSNYNRINEFIFNNMYNNMINYNNRNNNNFNFNNPNNFNNNGGNNNINQDYINNNLYNNNNFQSNNFNPNNGQAFQPNNNGY